MVTNRRKRILLKVVEVKDTERQGWEKLLHLTKESTRFSTSPTLSEVTLDMRLETSPQKFLGFRKKRHLKRPKKKTGRLKKNR